MEAMYVHAKKWKVGDRIAWWPAHLSGMNSNYQQGEIVRVDRWKGEIVRYIVFSDYATFEKVSGKDLIYARLIPLRMEIPKDVRAKIVLGRMVQGGDREFVIGALLPNNFVLPECPKEYPKVVPVPWEVEYLKLIPGSRVRKNYRGWREDTHNPYILRIPQLRVHIRHPKPNLGLIATIHARLCLTQ